MELRFCYHVSRREIAGLVLTTEAMIADAPEEKGEGAGMGGMGMGM